jgi:hypothetical protein
MSTSLRWLETGCRYFICLLMLVYGLVKIFHGQFYTDEYWKDTPLGALSGMQLVWSFTKRPAALLFSGCFAQFVFLCWDASSSCDARKHP